MNTITTEDDFIDLFSLKAYQEHGDAIPTKEALYPDFTLICDTRKANVGPSVEHRCLDYILFRRNELSPEFNKRLNINNNHQQFKENEVSYGIVVDQYLSLPERQPMPANPEEEAHLTIPGPTWPSDHFSIAYDVRIGQITAGDSDVDFNQ